MLGQVLDLQRLLIISFFNENDLLNFSRRKKTKVVTGRLGSEEKLKMQLVVESRNCSN